MEVLQLYPCKNLSCEGQVTLTFKKNIWIFYWESSSFQCWHWFSLLCQSEPPGAYFSYWVVLWWYLTCRFVYQCLVLLLCWTMRRQRVRKSKIDEASSILQKTVMRHKSKLLTSPVNKVKITCFPLCKVSTFLKWKLKTFPIWQSILSKYCTFLSMILNIWTVLDCARVFWCVVNQTWQHSGDLYL